MPLEYFHNKEKLYNFLLTLESTRIFFQPAELFYVIDEHNETGLFLHYYPLNPNAFIHNKQDYLIVEGKGYHLLKYNSRKLLLELITPLTWEKAPPINWIYFWIRSEDLFKQIVKENLKFGNDQQRYAEINSNGNKSILLQIRQMDYYLLYNWLDKKEKDLEIFYPLSHNKMIKIAWGYYYPLERRIAQLPDTNTHFFIYPDGTLYRIQDIKFQDVYHKLHIEKDFELITWTSTNEENLSNIPISLHLEPTEEHRETELWLIEEKQHWMLERLINEITIRDLEDLLITQVTYENKKIWIIKELLTGHKKNYIELNGEAFYPLMKDEHLYVPIGFQIAPFVGRRNLIKVFDLRKDFIVLLEQKDEKLFVYRIENKYFVPLSKIVNYFISAAELKIKQLESKVIFDLKFDTSLFPKQKPSLLEKIKEIFRIGN